MEEKISVVVPIYNVELFLERCLDSLIRQSYRNLELILINDGSTDKSGEICEIYKKRDNRIKVVHKNNGGLSEARNVGIDHATGDYIAFIDSDDWIHEEYFSILYNILQKTRSNIAVCDFLKVYESNNLDYEIKDLDCSVQIFSRNEALNALAGDLYVQMVIACGKLYERSLFEEIRFPLGKLHEDEFVTYKLFANSEKIVYTSLKIYYYWQRSDSIMGQKFTLKSRTDAFDAFYEKIVFYNDEGLEDAKNKLLKSLLSIYIYMDNAFKGEQLFIERERQIKNILGNISATIKVKILYNLYFKLPRTFNFILRVFRKNE